MFVSVRHLVTRSKTNKISSKVSNIEISLFSLLCTFVLPSLFFFLLFQLFFCLSSHFFFCFSSLFFLCISSLFFFCLSSIFYFCLSSLFLSALLFAPVLPNKPNVFHSACKHTNLKFSMSLAYVSCLTSMY